MKQHTNRNWKSPHLSRFWTTVKQKTKVANQMLCLHINTTRPWIKSKAQSKLIVVWQYTRKSTQLGRNNEENTNWQATGLAPVSSHMPVKPNNYLYTGGRDYNTGQILACHSSTAPTEKPVNDVPAIQRNNRNLMLKNCGHKLYTYTDTEWLRTGAA